MTTVTGYNQLSAPARRLFTATARNHQAAVGRDYKDGWTPVKVQERRDHLRVWFKNGDWLHYWPNGTWG